jgi:hypothetical protein
MAPAIMMTNMAGPSPASAKLKSRPHLPQFDFKLKNPANNFPLPQRGQRHRRPATYGDGAVTGFCFSEISISSFLRFDWVATDQANPNR